MSEIIKKFKKGDLLHIDKDGKAQWGQPEGYPHKERRVDVDLKPLVGVDIVLCKVSDNTPEPLPVGNYVRIWGKNGGTYQVSVYSASESHFMIGDGMFVLVLYEDNYFLNGISFPEKGVYFLNDNTSKLTITGVAWNPDATQPDITWDGVFEATTPFSSGFLPIATSTTHGAVKQMPYLPNATGDAPTAENFNQLVRQLKNAGLMK